MSFITQIELLVFIRNFRNVDLFQQGIYRIQISIPKHLPYLTLDQLGITKLKKQRDQRLVGQDIRDQYYLSSSFAIRYEDEEINLCEGCIFRIEQNTFAQQNSVELQVDLFFLDSKSAETFQGLEALPLNKLSSQTYVIHSLKQINHNYLPITFDPNTACVINCFVFSLPLNLKYQQRKDGLTMIDYIQKYKRKGQYELLQQKTFDYLESIFKQFIQQYKETIAEFITEPTKFAHYLSHLACLGEVEYNSEDLERQINSISLQLYMLWYVYIDVISKVYAKLMKKLKFKYISELQDLYEEFVIKINNFPQFDKTLKNCNLINSLRQLDQRILPILPITSTEILDNLPILLKYSQNEMKQYQLNQKKAEIKHLIVFVHGYKGSPFDMRRWRNIIKIYYPKCFTLLSSCNQREGEESIRVMGHKLSIEIQAQIQLMDGIDELSFICHSLGGVVARSALCNLSMHQNKMKFYVSLGSPHVGLFVKQNSLVKTGLWFMTNFSSSQSMAELQLQDASMPQNSYLYYLSTVQSLEWFQKVILVSSTQDDFVPFEIARLEKSTRVPQDKQQIYQTMLDNIKLPECTRIEVNFIYTENDKNWDNFIGRTAHMNLVENTTMIRMIVTQSRLLD
ncbi:unnamed protein product [Paramecium octaurelia]|uniref:DUF676 domain-containing protein n=1 Tax=Paramecium octaurelia TaxID=43137 RepID=A0A8S1SZ63_PAROT|nr:unnamed protein product [Paramecium octaurelia]